MSLDIVIKHDEFYDCLENLVLAVAKLWKKDYQLMSADVWDFSYKTSEQDNMLSLGQSVSNNAISNYDNLAKYHGISMKFVETSDYLEGLDVIKNELSNNRPVAIYMDTFWCNWYKVLYKKLHRPHYCLVIGIDTETNDLYIVDSQMANEETILPIKEFIHGFEAYITFSNEDVDIKNFDWKVLLQNSLKKNKNIENLVNIFEEMRKFAVDISSKLDLQNEIIGLEKFPFKAKIFQELFTLGKRRKQYSRMLAYIGKLYDIKELDAFSSRMKLAGDRWSSIFGLLCKAYYMNNDIKIINKIASKIEEAANDEENIADNLLEFCKYGNNNLCNTSIEHINNKMDIYCFLNLSSHMNNQGFSNSLLPTCSAQLSDDGRYFLADNLPTDKIWNIANMKFSFPTIFNNSYDNISCMGQIINVDQAMYNYIMLLGCSELGDYREHINIKYLDGFIERIPIEFTAWIKPQPSYGEIIAWTGSRAVRTENEVEVSSFAVHLYAKNYQLKHDGKVECIELPTCPNIHIFAISLGK